MANKLWLRLVLLTFAKLGFARLGLTWLDRHIAAAEFQSREIYCQTKGSHKAIFYLEHGRPLKASAGSLRLGSA